MTAPSWIDVDRPLKSWLDVALTHQQLSTHKTVLAFERLRVTNWTTMRDHIQFSLNGEMIAEHNVQPDRTLLDYLRGALPNTDQSPPHRTILPIRLSWLVLSLSDL